MPATGTDLLTAPVEQAALLWCMRFWVAGRRGSSGAAARILRMAGQLDAPQAAKPIDGFMNAVEGGMLGTIEIGCLRCIAIGDDERLLLDALGLAQERRLFEALLILRRFLDPEAARTALFHANALGVALARVGRFLPAPDSEAQLGTLWATILEG